MGPGGELVGRGGVCRQSWKISNLSDPHTFPIAVQAAAEADVLVVSVRDAGELPVSLNVWTDAWNRGQSPVVWALNESRGAARECDRYLMGQPNLP